jgi:glycosyltransferase involved in cell wall biosynthesis
MSTTPPRKVLVIAYYFPPMGLSGVQRTLKFVKYLPDFGWQPTVLTVTPTGYFAQDQSLLDEISSRDVLIERVGSLDPNRLFKKKGVVKMPSERWRKILTYLSDTFFIPDNKIGWKKKAVDTASKLFEQHHYDVIFATAPPFTGFLIGKELSKKFHKPLVIDYRDSWLDYPTKYYPTPFHRWRNYKLEKSVLRAASRIITTNRRVKELILKRYKYLEYNDIAILSQGYDPADFQNTTRQSSPRERMRITHAGVFYGDRTPVYFLQALKKVFAQQPSLVNDIEASFVGTFQDEYAGKIKEMGLEKNVTVSGYLEHKACVQHLLDSDVLWLMLNNDTQSPGKLYEYFAARKPIIACVPDGFIRQTIKEAEAGIVVAPDDVDGIANAILLFYEQWKSKSLISPKEEVVLKYDRVNLTNELSKIFGFLAD